MRILIAENDLKNLTNISVIALSIGFEVISAKNGQEALKLCEKEPIDCLFTNVCLPLLDGATLVRKVKSLQGELPVILSSLFSVQDQVLKNCDYFCPLHPFNKNNIINALLTVKYKAIANRAKREKTLAEEKSKNATSFATANACGATAEEKAKTIILCSSI